MPKKWKEICSLVGCDGLGLRKLEGMNELMLYVDCKVIAPVFNNDLLLQDMELPLPCWFDRLHLICEKLSVKKAFFGILATLTGRLMV